MKFKKPKVGDFRVVTRFLWTPRRFDGNLIWLETVSYRQHYTFVFLVGYTWCDICLVNPKSGDAIEFDPIKKGDSKYPTKEFTHWKNGKPYRSGGGYKRQQPRTNSTKFNGKFPKITNAISIHDFLNGI